MITTILGIKKGMSSMFDQKGRRIPVTQIEAEPNVVVDIKENRIALGFGKKKKAKKTENKIVADIGYAPRRIKEIKTKDETQVKIGDKVTVAFFQTQDEVKITGITRGRGFAGGVKRWGFHGGPKTHGQSDRHRAPGSIGQGTTPGRVYKGKKMAGHYGVDQFTVIGLEVMGIDLDKNLLLVKGAVPGARNGFVIVEKVGKVKAYIAPPEEKPDEEDEPSSAKATEGKEEKKETKGAEEKENQSKEEGKDK